MGNESFMRELTNERGRCPTCSGSGRNRGDGVCFTCGGTGMVGGAPPIGSIRAALTAGLVWTVAGLVLVMVFLLFIAHL